MFFLLFLTAVEAAAQESQTITLADNGKTIILKANETFLLKLGEGYEWDITLDDQTIFSRVVNVLVVRGAQGIYVAQRPGNATLTAVGSPRMPEIAASVCQTFNIVQAFCGCARAGASARDFWF